MKTHSRHFRTISIISGIIILASTGSALAWWPHGHTLLTRLSVKVLPSEIPHFFKTGGDAIARYVVDPDAVKNRSFPCLESAEQPEHYFDSEWLPDDFSLPGNRYEYIAYCYKNGISPEKAGFLPYAIMESVERLALAFAEYRKWPTDKALQWKCYIIAGYCAHYAQDLCQPLHVTVHYDGRAGDDYVSPRSGIHARVDAVIEKADLKDRAIIDGIVPKTFDSIFVELVKLVKEEQMLVDSVYALEKYFSSDSTNVALPEPLRSFALARSRQAVYLTASLYLTAWQLSRKTALENWLIRFRAGS